MHLPLILPNLALQPHILPLAVQNGLDPLPRLPIQQTILRPQRQPERPRHGLQIPRNVQQTRVRRERRVAAAYIPGLGDLGPARLQDGVAPSPAEPHGADLARAGQRAQGVYEAVDQGRGNGFAVAEQPGAEGYGDGGRVGGFFGEGERGAGGEWGFDGCEEGDGEGVAGVDVRDVDVEAGEGVAVREEAGVGEGPAEDFERGGG